MILQLRVRPVQALPVTILRNLWIKLSWMHLAEGLVSRLQRHLRHINHGKGRVSRLRTEIRKRRPVGGIRYRRFGIYWIEKRASMEENLQTDPITVLATLFSRAYPVCKLLKTVRKSLAMILLVLQPVFTARPQV
jgi:hypothetical protein